MNCYIIDDEQHCIDILINYINKTPGLNLSGYSTIGDRAIRDISLIKDTVIVFLDIDMPELSGLEIASLLPDNVRIIFTTAHLEYASEAFNLDAVDFLHKPIAFLRFIKSINKAKLKTNAEREVKQLINRTLFINPGTRNKVIQIAVNEILYVEGLKNYVIIYTTGEGKHITYLTVGDIEAALPSSQFLRGFTSLLLLTRITSRL